ETRHLTPASKLIILFILLIILSYTLFSFDTNIGSFNYGHSLQENSALTNYGVFGDYAEEKIHNDGADSTNYLNKIEVYSIEGGIAIASNTNTGETYTTIQAAIDASVPGDAIFITENGSYSEELSFLNKTNIAIIAYSLIASNNMTAVMLSGAGSGIGILISNSCDNRVEGFSLTNYQIGIKVYGSSRYNLIANNILKNNSFAGLFYDTSMSYNTNTNMTFQGGTYGIIMSNSHDDYAANNTIFSNTYGIGVIDGSYSNVILSNMIFKNSVNGIICQDSTNITIDGNTVHTHTNGSGIAVIDSAFISLTNCIVSNNTSVEGGGVFISNSVSSSVHGDINSNSAATGGGIYIKSSINSTINANIYNNHATSTGGGLYIMYSTNNTVDIQCAYNIADTVDGGGIYLYNCASNTITGDLYGNIAPNGPANQLTYTRNTVVSASIYSNNSIKASLYLYFATNTRIESDIYHNVNSGTSVGYTVSLYDGSNNAIANSTIMSNSTGNCRIIGLSGGTMVTISNSIIGGTNGSTNYAIFEAVSDLSGHTIYGNSFYTNMLGSLYYDFSGSIISNNEINVLNNASNPRHDANVAIYNKVMPANYIASNTTTGMEYFSVQEAVDDASVNETVVVYTSTINEAVVITNNNISLIALPWITNSNNTAVVFESSPSGTNIAINSTNVKVEGFTIRNSTYGIYITNAYNQIYNNIIYSNDIRGVYIIGESADNNRVISNTIWGLNQNAGVAIREGDNNYLYRNDILLNYSDGIYFQLEATNNIIVENSIFSNNRSGIYILSSNANYNQIASNTIWSSNQING
ncbi:right-handed parallel beta-helix repeat-containing protein, partial [Spirochaetota bacterium]